MEGDLEVLDQKFYMADNVDQKQQDDVTFFNLQQQEQQQSIPVKKRKSKNYSSTKIKAHNFLANISYKWLVNNDAAYQYFILDRYSFIFQYLNWFCMKRKFNESNTKLIKLLWEDCMLRQLIYFMYLNGNFKRLNNLDLKFNSCSNIIKTFI